MVNRTCLLVGTPRGFTRSVLEALLKRGSKVLFACSNKELGKAEQKRLSSLYGPGQVYFTPADPFSRESLDHLFKRALNTLGEVDIVVNSTANNALKVNKEELSGNLRDVEEALDNRLVSEDVSSAQLLSSLTVKHLGTHRGGSGGIFLNLSSGVELARGGSKGQCTVLGTTRSLGLSRRIASHGVKPISVYQPIISSYPYMSPHGQITDDEHTPYSQWSRYSSYIREYTGYMALHIGQTAPGGTAWKFNKDLRIEEVQPEDVHHTCGVANKMCFWLGCPMVCDETDNASTAGGSQQEEEKKPLEIEINGANCSASVDDFLKEDTEII